MERMSANGFFFHRNCFKCSHCNCQLKIGGYSLSKGVGNEKGKFYCSAHYRQLFLSNPKAIGYSSEAAGGGAAPTPNETASSNNEGGVASKTETEKKKTDTTTAAAATSDKKSAAHKEKQKSPSPAKREATPSSDEGSESSASGKEGAEDSAKPSLIQRLRAWTTGGDRTSKKSPSRSRSSSLEPVEEELERQQHRSLRQKEEMKKKASVKDIVAAGRCIVT